MRLDKFYIEEAKRIRKTYLSNLAEIVRKEDEIKLIFKMIEDIKNQVHDEENVNESYYINKSLELNEKIEKIQSIILPYYDKIKALDGDQRTLYNNIKEKYPNITDDEIQEQIVPSIKPVDKEFLRKNEELYQKILNR